MSDYTKVEIDICENGFVVKIPETNIRHVFTTTKQLQKWLENNITETGQVKDFCEGLDKGSDNLDIDRIIESGAKAIQQGIDEKLLEQLTKTYK